jgi:hypothetical protein
MMSSSTPSILALGGDDLSRLPLFMRKTNLAQLLRGRPDGIFVAPFELGEIGPALFDAACRMRLEGIVSKHRERPYRGPLQVRSSETGSDTRSGAASECRFFANTGDTFVLMKIDC